jgi:hypothetical protein
MAITISGDSPNLTSASLTTPTLTSPTFAGTPSGSVITSMTAQASTSGTSIDFTSIPSWVKRITVLFNGVSSNGSSNLVVQIGDSGGIETTGYANTVFNPSSTYVYGTAHFVVTATTTSSVTWSGSVVISLIGSNVWAETSILSGTGSAYIGFGSGAKTLSDTLDRVRITTSGGTDTFDAGTINILYE